MFELLYDYLRLQGAVLGELVSSFNIMGFFCE